MNKMTKNSSPICITCRERIAFHGIICVEIVEEVCKAELDGDISFIHEKKCDVVVRKAIEYLEQRNYLISTEADEHRLVLKPSRRELYGIGLYCWCCN